MRHTPLFAHLSPDVRLKLEAQRLLALLLDVQQVGASGGGGNELEALRSHLSDALQASYLAGVISSRLDANLEQAARDVAMTVARSAYEAQADSFVTFLGEDDVLGLMCFTPFVPWSFEELEGHANDGTDFDDIPKPEETQNG